ncbi:hypothetical protein CL622_00955 [archaeon]|nr:hypothetical protein [archaeon]|tara:strand:+ start:38 stop:532 length:495 start_codon:yes stop_codon:yes gene_type:complete
MILLDTNILSTFARIDRFDLLYDIFEDSQLYISPNVYMEIKHAEIIGYIHAKKVIDALDQEKITIIHLSRQAKKEIPSLPKSFGKGELDSVAIAKSNKSIFITNEKKVVNYCQKNQIDVITLNSLLRYLWEEKILTKQQVKDLIDEIELKDRLVITAKKEIFDE